MKSILIFVCCLHIISCSQPSYDFPHVVIETGYGDIELELYPEKAPQTVAAFLRHTDNGLYDNSSFYRVVRSGETGTPLSTGVIQGGIFPHSEKKAQPGIPHESTSRSGLSHTDGTLSMARTGPGTASSEFFICIGDQSPLDSGRRGSADGLGYAAFGKVFSGMKTVRKIQSLPGSGESFDQQVKINKVRRL